MLLLIEVMQVQGLLCHQICEEEGQVGLLEVSSQKCAMQNVARDGL